MYSQRLNMHNARCRAVRISRIGVESAVTFGGAAYFFDDSSSVYPRANKSIQLLHIFLSQLERLVCLEFVCSPVHLFACWGSLIPRVQLHVDRTIGPSRKSSDCMSLAEECGKYPFGHLNLRLQRQWNTWKLMIRFISVYRLHREKEATWLP